MSTIPEQTRWLDAVGQAELVRRGELTPAELVTAAAERIEALDGPLNAVGLRWFDQALEIARSAALPRGPFHGVPFLLKDLWATQAGRPITNGSRALKDAGYVAPVNTWLVDRFEAAGLVTLGRGNSPEWGSLPTTEPEAFGPTRTPWDLTRSSGGSSGGSAAAVAAGMVPIAHASDGGGSIRVPASCCGLVGLKTSQGRITLGPAREESGTSVEFVVSRTVRDSAAMLDAVHGPGIGDTVVAARPVRPYADEVGADPGRLRVGVLAHHPFGLAIDAECAAAATGAGRLLESLGHHVSEAYPSALSDASTARTFSTIWALNMAAAADRTEAALGRELTEDDVEAVNWAMVRFARSLGAVELARTQGAAARFRREVQAWWSVDGWDLLVTPTLGELPAPVGSFANDRAEPLAPFKRSAGYVPFTSAYNLSYNPAISVPLHWTSSGLPVGVQLVAAYGREDLLVRVASQLEQASPWAHRTPAV